MARFLLQDKFKVKVKNRLKGKYKNHRVDIMKNQANQLVDSIFSGGAADLPDSEDKVPIETLLLDPVSPKETNTGGSGEDIFIRIRANRECKVSLIEADGRRKWQLDFIESESGKEGEGPPMFKTAAAGGPSSTSEDSGPDVNVSVEDDEDIGSGSTGSTTVAYSLCAFSLGSLATKVALEKIPEYWWLLPVISGILGLGILIISKLKGKKSDEVVTMKEISKE